MHPQLQLQFSRDRARALRAEAQRERDARAVRSVRTPDSPLTAVLNALAAVSEQAGGVDEIERIVRVVIFVASAPGFTGHPQVGNGASQLLQDVFGEAGRHARSAVGVASLPMDAPVEVELVVAVGTTPTIHPV